jgi:AraC-like DNA-binding protein
MIPVLLTELSQKLPTMPGNEAYEAIRTCALLIASAFGKQTRLSGNARNAARAAAFGVARQYIEANLRQLDLSPESVLKVCQISRPTLYRMFEHEGGLATYIRNRRLREAADELRADPYKAVIEIAYDLGFNSASDFNHAFRRAYDMTPLDFRAMTARAPSR